EVAAQVNQAYSASLFVIPSYINQLLAELHIAAHSSVHSTQCGLAIAPWFSTKYPCLVYTFDCDAWNDARTTNCDMEFPDKRTLLALNFVDCCELVVPNDIQRFPNLLGINMVNVTLISWPLEAALAPEIFHSILFLVFSHVKWTTFPDALLAPPPDSLRDVEISHTNLSVIPDDLDQHWPNVDDQLIEYKHILESLIKPARSIAYWQQNRKRVGSGSYTATNLARPFGSQPVIDDIDQLYLLDTPYCGAFTTSGLPVPAPVICDPVIGIPNVRHDKPRIVKAGETLDGDMKTYERTSNTLGAQLLTLKNAIIGKNQRDDVHCDKNDSTIESAWRDDVCENALATKKVALPRVSRAFKVADDEARSSSLTGQAKSLSMVSISVSFAVHAGPAVRSNVVNVLTVSPPASAVTLRANSENVATSTSRTIPTLATRPLFPRGHWARPSQSR
ncbi:TPA: hypothetical protein N0F65_007293, partial [Lagenidium giganteum]